VYNRTLDLSSEHGSTISILTSVTLDWINEVLMSKVWLTTGSSCGLDRALSQPVLAAGKKLGATAST
jgi:hypothetical protein